MTDFILNPTGDQVSKAGFQSHAAYHRARKRQAKLDQWQARNDENSTATPERSSRLPQHLDRPYCGSYTQRALHPVLEEQTEAQVTTIPALSPQDEKDARRAFEKYHYPHTLTLERRAAMMAFGSALHITVPGETWGNLDSTRRDILTRLIESPEARERFGK